MSQPAALFHAEPEPLHHWAWAAWLLAALALLMTVRNPLYLLLLLLVIGVVRAALPPLAAGPILAPWRFALLAVPASALFNAVSAHVGRTTLFSLPEWLPLVGGPVMLEALLFGALNGLVLTGIFAAFVTLNEALPVRALVRLIPRAFQPVAVVVTVALTFVPATLRHFEQIREAQAIRGHRVSGLRDWLPLWMPLLVGGLERAFQLAEAMTARGFAREEQPLPLRERLALVVGLLLLLAGAIARLGWRVAGSGVPLLVGGALLALVLWRVGRRVPHSPYRSQPWRIREWLLLLAAGIALLPLLGLPGLDRRGLFFYPYPTIPVPTFHPPTALCMLALLAPALWHLPARSTVASSGPFPQDDLSF